MTNRRWVIRLDRSHDKTAYWRGWGCETTNRAGAEWFATYDDACNAIDALPADVRPLAVAIRMDD